MISSLVTLLSRIDDEHDNRVELAELRKQADYLVEFFKYGQKESMEELRQRWSHAVQVIMSLRQAETERQRDALNKASNRRGSHDATETIGDVLKRVSGTFSNGPSDASGSPATQFENRTPPVLTPTTYAPSQRLTNSDRNPNLPSNPTNSQSSDLAANQLMQWMGLYSQNDASTLPLSNDIWGGWGTLSYDDHSLNPTQDPFLAAMSGLTTDVDYALGTKSELFSM